MREPILAGILRLNHWISEVNSVRENRVDHA